jgi:hypothetical protein
MPAVAATHGIEEEPLIITLLPSAISQLVGRRDGARRYLPVTGTLATLPITIGVLLAAIPRLRRTVGRDLPIAERAKPPSKRRLGSWRVVVAGTGSRLREPAFALGLPAPRRRECDVPFGDVLFGAPELAGAGGTNPSRAAIAASEIMRGPCGCANVSSYMACSVRVRGRPIRFLSTTVPSFGRSTLPSGSSGSAVVAVGSCMWKHLT